jgi:HSP20 family protein
LAFDLQSVIAKGDSMANQEMKTNEDQKAPGQELTHSQQRGLARGSGFPAGFITPGDFFRMTPFSLMRRMTEEMDRVLGEFGLSGGDGGKGVWSPAIEVSEHDGNYVVRAELPGVNPGDVKLEITNDAVILQGERKIEHEETKSGLHLTERLYGNFYRSIPLPEGANIDQARAKFDNGVLELTVPVQEQRSKRREVQIETNAQGSAASSGKAA